MKPAHLKAVTDSKGTIPYQSASIDIWDKKYCLKTRDGQSVDTEMDDTYKRVAKAIAEVEPENIREEWYGQFLWALRHGAIPAGRIMSNAGALEHKPATSTINCTVSGSITDSMDDILQKVHEAGLTLKAGCGIGYEFSTLRPKGAYVSGAGAYTSGPLSFMDIYDKMCFTVSSAGGRRGAQMATFDIGHPDVMDFIRAKREDGRLRQFNLSLLITDEFMHAVDNDLIWKLAFPVNEDEVGSHDLDLQDIEQVIWREWPISEGYVTNSHGLVACRVYKSIPAKRLWDMIMSSTYDFAEPGFILIDKVNQMNNNWFCENIRATNPCVVANTWVQTSEGPRQVNELLGKAFKARVDGQDHASGEQGFFKTDNKQVFCLRTQEGHQLRLTADHRVRRVIRFDKNHTTTEWCEASSLEHGDRILLNNHRDKAEWPGAYSQDEGYLLGLLSADGMLTADTAILSAWQLPVAANGNLLVHSRVNMMNEVLRCADNMPQSGQISSWQNIAGQNESQLSLRSLRDLAFKLGMQEKNDTISSALENSSSCFHQGFLRGIFDASASVRCLKKSGSICLVLPELAKLEAVQRMLLRLGIASVIIRNSPLVEVSVTDDSTRDKDQSANQYQLLLRGDNIVQFKQQVGFIDSVKADLLNTLLDNLTQSLECERFIAQIESVTADGHEEVYDVQVPGINTFDANGLHAHNCGEQPLPPYGSCLLGSINLTRFVHEPFTKNARFDWKEYSKTISIFTRLLDNVVEINGLPLEGQRDAILNKRRHGMGFLGLGSSMTMLRMKYGSSQSLKFTERVSRELALAGWQAGLELAKEKGPAPIMEEDFIVTATMLRQRPEMKVDGFELGDKVKGKVLLVKYSRYMQQLAEVAPELVEELQEVGARFTHHSSIAPTGTISLSLANNASNGIEPSFAHHYARNVIREGKKSKEKVDVYSFELLAYRELINADAMPYVEEEGNKLPDYFITAEDITPKEHVDVQAASQKWIDSSISKTANVPTNYPFEDFKSIYHYAYSQGLKGCTTFRFNPAAFQGVLVKEHDLENTTYKFTLENGEVVEVKGNEEIDYDGEVHTAANLYDALKEGYYGKF
ncbi:Ribonucleotide reductase of class II (coenzyme B12-dependent) [hydrothermal vent metagenome]|uniref:Ribonucleotide reductase of class II (Coenzyme B12-dependent) n=1 Tax=hydrothermal vent metagenome TaxID=652676 RepID=A0A3B0Y6Q5_9ZZZZ